MMCNDNRTKIWGLTLAAVSFFACVLIPAIDFIMRGE